jgi:PKD repeat protein
MKRRNFFDQLGQSSTATTLALVVVVVVWTLVFLAIIGGIIFFVERPIQAQQPATSVPTPVISVEPTVGPGGTTVTIHGQGWAPGTRVSIYLLAPGQTQIPNFASAGATADTQGQFTVSVVIPSEDGWQTAGTATIIAQTTGGGPSAQASFNVLAPSEQPTATPTPTTPSTPTPTPTQPSTPTPTPAPATPTVTARVNLHIRSGPGTNYPVVGVLLAGQSAQITGVSADGNWWQISFAGAQNGRGWISAYYVAAENTQNVPVVEAPSLPPTPTPTPQPQPPTAVISGPTTAQLGQSVTFDGNGSSASTGSIVHYEWAFGDGTIASGVTVSHTYQQGGTYVVTLTVTDSQGLLGSTTQNIQIGQPSPTADISGPKQGSVDQSITFDGSGSSANYGNIVDYEWDFGDGTSASGSSVTHVYTQPGDYEVTLTVTNSAGLTASTTHKIQIEAAPTAIISAPTTGQVGQPITFDGSGSTTSDNNIVSYAWNFGDGTTANGVSVTHTYSQVGSYQVSLTVTDDQGATATATQMIQIGQPLPPAAVISILTAGQAGQPTVLDGSGSTPGVGQIVKYEWNFGDGTIGSGARVVHIYIKAGSYTISLTVTNSDGLTATATQIIHIEQSSPTAIISGPTTGAVGQSIAFDGSGSTAGIGQIVQYEWNFGDGTTGTGAKVVHTYTKAGPYIITLTVTNSDGLTARARQIIQIEQLSPTAVISGPTTGAVDQPIAFDGSGSSANGGQIVKYEWNFGDGSTGNGAHVTHAYTKAGSYTVSLTVTDSDGATATAEHTIQIEQPSPVAPIQGPSRSLPAPPAAPPPAAPPPAAPPSAAPPPVAPPPLPPGR